MTLEEAIDNFEREIVEFEGLKKIRAVTHEDYAEIERIRQLAGWLRDYKRLKEQEPCDDAISREMALKECYDIVVGGELYRVIQEETLLGLPPVRPQPKMERWISDAIQGEIDGQIVKGFTCSKCGAISLFRMTSGKIVNGDLCPNCGAKMEAEDNG